MTNSPVAQPQPLRKLFAGVIVVSLAIEAVFWAAFLLSPLRYRTDFRQLYVAGYMARTGRLHHLYDLDLQRTLQNQLVSYQPVALPYIRPAYAALMYAPFSLLGYSYAYFAWMAVNLGLLALSVRYLFITARVEEKPLFAFIALSFVPLQIALMQGQDSILLLLVFCLVMLQLQRAREFWAGALLGLALFKFQFVIPIAGLFFLKRRWDFAAGFVVAAAMICALSISLVGPPQARVYFSLMNIASSQYHQSVGHEVFWTKMANLAGFAFGVAGSMLKPSTIHLGVLAASAAIFLLVAVLTPDLPAALLLLTAIVAAVFAGPYAYAHDLTILLLPMAFALAGGNVSKASRGGYFGFALYCAMLLQFAAPNHFYLVAILLGIFLTTMVGSARKAPTVSGVFT